MALQSFIQSRLGMSRHRAAAAIDRGSIPLSRIFDEYGAIDDEKFAARRLANRILQKERYAKIRERLRQSFENKRRRAPKRNEYLDPRTSAWWQLYVDGNAENLSDPKHSRAQLFRRQFRVPWTFFQSLVRSTC
jgi:hypothetical protein